MAAKTTATTAPKVAPGGYRTAANGGNGSGGNKAAAGSSNNKPSSDFNVILQHGSPGTGKKTYKGATVKYLMDELKTLAQPDVQALQRSLINAGYLTEKQIKSWGSGIDAKTREAYKRLLTYASTNRYTPTEALQLLINEQLAKAALKGPKAPVFSYTPPDPQELRDAFGQILPGVLGRSLSDAETEQLVKEFSDRFASYARSEFNTSQGGGASLPKPDFESFAKQRSKELHPEEADTFDRFQLGSEVMQILGLNAPVQER